MGGGGWWGFTFLPENNNIIFKGSRTFCRVKRVVLGGGGGGGLSHGSQTEKIGHVVVKLLNGSRVNSYGQFLFGKP